MRITAALLASFLLLVGCGVDALAQTPGLQLKVAMAIAKDLGIETQSSPSRFDVQILAAGVRVQEQGRLHVAAVRAVGESGGWLLRMECSARIDCIPFEVVLHPRGPEAAHALGSSGVLPSVGAISRFASTRVRAGQRVQLAEEASGMHLSASAVCLEAGSMGQRIRVRNIASGHVVLARVRAAGQVVVED